MKETKTYMHDQNGEKVIPNRRDCKLSDESPTNDPTGRGLNVLINEKVA